MYQKESPAGSNEPSMENLMLNDVMTSQGLFTDMAGMAFTPTTMTQFESTLNEINDNMMAGYSTAGALKYDSSANRLWGNMGRSSQEFSEYEDDDDSDDSNSNTGDNKRTKNGQTYTEMTTVSGQPEQRVRKLPGPRPSRTLEEMTPLEAERRRRRRERNKNAAAKCRQRRVDQTNELLLETEQLEQESSRLEREIEQLRRQKHQLEFVLEAHKPTCRAVLPLPTNTAQSHQIKLEKPEQMLAPSTSVMRPNSLPIPATCRGSVVTTSSSVFSFDTSTGLTPMFSGDMGSPTSYLMVSPSTLLA